MKVRSIRSKVLIAITGITLLTAAAMAFVFYGRSSRMIEENYITVLSQRTRLLTDTVDDMLKNVCNIDIKASCDSEVKEELEQYLNDKDEKRLNNISTRLRTFSKMDQAITSMYLVIPGERQVVTTLDYPVYRSGLKEDNLRQFETLCGKNDGPAIWMWKAFWKKHIRCRAVTAVSLADSGSAVISSRIIIRCIKSRQH